MLLKFKMNTRTRIAGGLAVRKLSDKAAENYFNEDGNLEIYEYNLDIKEDEYGNVITEKRYIITFLHEIIQEDITETELNNYLSNYYDTPPFNGPYTT